MTPPVCGCHGVGMGWVKDPRYPPRNGILGFDVENRPAAYWYDGKTTSEITAIAWKWLDDPDVHVLLLHPDGRFQHDDRRRRLSAPAAYQFFRGILESAALVYGHNVRRHDLATFQSGLERFGLPLLSPVRTCDTLADYPKRKDKSASLETLATDLDLDLSKIHMGVADWERANRLTSAALALTRRRVVGDVLLQEQLRLRLLELGYLAPARLWKPGR